MLNLDSHSNTSVGTFLRRCMAKEREGEKELGREDKTSAKDDKTQVHFLPSNCLTLYAETHCVGNL